MATVKLLHFGTLDSKSLEEYYDVDIDVDRHKIEIDLNFNDTIIEVPRLEVANHFIENIRIHDLNNRKHLKADFNNDEEGVVQEYIRHHLEELATDELTRLIGAGAKTPDKPALLFKHLHLVRVGLYPDSETEFATFDYSIGRELTDDLVVVFTDENGNLHYITTES